jgi:hypothetical protein
MNDMDTSFRLTVILAQPDSNSFDTSATRARRRRVRRSTPSGILTSPSRCERTDWTYRMRENAG